MDAIETEKRKYEKVWSNRAYAKQADGEPVLEEAYKLLGCKPGESLIDWGCGCGRPAQKFQDKGLSVLGVDIAHNCMDEGITVPFLQRCLWDWPLDGISSDYAFCTDVLEHIPYEYLLKVIRNMFRRTHKAAFIQVCTAHDTYGRKMDPPEVLHLTVMPEKDWLDLLSAAWSRIYPVPNLGGKSRSCFVCYGAGADQVV